MRGIRSTVGCLGILDQEKKKKKKKKAGCCGVGSGVVRKKVLARLRPCIGFWDFGKTGSLVLGGCHLACHIGGY